MFYILTHFPNIYSLQKSSLTLDTPIYTVNQLVRQSWLRNAKKYDKKDTEENLTEKPPHKKNKKRREGNPPDTKIPGPKKRARKPKE